ncbi:hypothetical protein SJ05684_b57090 (plasmid) [Sinorhizobium sojae CCBAU 05684]|uniref:Uncharacterized protein n=1 Tax=Sinorhizobium sojae CCBAU 05684 TaxID=716928 RepID=A0A249PLA3_9HYPH|nr:hypothetical protein SJ05684_b57090 [Sinorhizobium sojae CCBAU 05684]
MSNVMVFPLITPEDRAYAAELQTARDRMLLITAELDKIRVVLAERGDEMSEAEAKRAGM